MANPLYNQFGYSVPNAPSQNNGGIMQIINQAQELKKTFKGNPRDAVQQLLNSGQMTQQQFNQYSQMANQIMSMLPR